MNKFFRGGRELSKGQRDNIMQLSRSKFGKRAPYQEPSKSPTIRKYINMLHIEVQHKLPTASKTTVNSQNLGEGFAVACSLLGDRYAAVRLRLIVFIIFCVLFSFSDLLGTGALAQSQHRTDVITMPKITRENISCFVNIIDKSSSRDRILRFHPNADLKKYPLFEYRAKMERIIPIKLNTKVPDFILDLPLRIVNDVHGRDSITLRELSREKILVLDFWATWCSPCLKSMHKWKELQPKFEQQVQVVGLMADYDYRAELTISERGWQMPQLIGPEAIFMIAYFCGTPIVGPSAWIKDGYFIGVTDTKADCETVLEELVNSRIDTIPEEAKWKFVVLEN